MVRLKATNPVKALRLATFQFHNGAIKSAGVQTLLVAYCSFQFHNGAIKSFPAWAISSCLFTFQFHNGAIKRPGWHSGR